MKPSLAILIFIFAGLLSCQDDEVLPLTPDLISEIKAYDLDNNGNSSDIRLDFEVEDNLNVVEYRIMILPSKNSDSFNKEIAASIPSPNYLEIIPEKFKYEYGFNRLSAGLLDVGGVPIQNDLEYVVSVFVIGTDINQLSDFSNPITLKDQGIYSGRHWIRRTQTCSDITDGTSEGHAANGNIYIELVGNDTDYSGTILHINLSNHPNIGRISFSLLGTKIQNYNRRHETICGTDSEGLPICDGVCYITELGDGTLIDELSFEISISNENCLLRSCEGTLSFFRQG